MSTCDDWDQPQLQLLMNNGDGTFRDASQRIHQNWASYERPDFDWPGADHWVVWPLIVDANGDGWYDILAVGCGVMDLLFENSGGKDFRIVANLTTEYRLMGAWYPSSVATGDLDGDGDMDVVFLYGLSETQQVLLRE